MRHALLTLAFLAAACGTARADIVGVLPLHGGYAFLGYATAGEIFGVLSRTGLYVAFGLLGLMYTLWSCITTTPGNLTRFWIYLATVVFIFTVFAPRRVVPNMVSYAESSGANVVKTTMEFAAERGTTGGEVPRGLYWVNQGLDKIASMITLTIDKITTRPENRLLNDYYSFLYIKTLVDEIGIPDEELAARTAEFKLSDFAVALTRFRTKFENDPEVEVALPTYPGDQRLKNFYTEEQWARWERLKSDLVAYSEEIYGTSSWQRMRRYVLTRNTRAPLVRGDIYRTEVLDPEDLLVKELIYKTDPGTTARARGGAAGFAEGRWYSAPVGLFVGMLANFKAVFMQAVIHGLPLAQAYFLYFALAMFPIVLLISLLPVPGWPVQVLLTYIMSLFWINLWSVGIALGNSFAQIGWQTSSYVESGLLIFLTAFFQLLTPIVLYLLVVRGSMGGISSIGSAIGGIGAGAAGAAGAAAAGAAKGASG